MRIRTPGGEQREVRVSDDALVMRDRRRSRFEEIERGDIIRMRLEEGDEDRPIAVRMMVRPGPHP